ncbi:MAG TPA: hypothetical protein VH913_01870 [Hyphomicrobiaceae bacterium]|jgi:hypothetical protein
MYWLGNTIAMGSLCVTILWLTVACASHALNDLFALTLVAPPRDEAARLVIVAANVAVVTWLPWRAAAYVLRGH